MNEYKQEVIDLAKEYVKIGNVSEENFLSLVDQMGTYVVCVMIHKYQTLDIAEVLSLAFGEEATFEDLKELVYGGEDAE